MKSTGLINAMTMRIRRGGNRKERRLPEGDDGRTIADMNIDGMPWYRRGGKESLPGEGSGRGQGMSDEEIRMYRFAAVKAGLLIVLIFGLVFFLFIAFCDFIWFGNR